MRKQIPAAKKPRVKQKFPPGWDEESVKAELAYFENQSEEEQLAEHEAAFSAKGQTVMVVPTELVPAIRQLIARHEQPRRKRSTARNGRRGSEAR
jgi:hypothetical protein